jgi:hypothetical protein
MAVDYGMDIFTSNSMLVLIRAAFSPTDDFQMCILGDTVGGCIDSVARDQQLSAFVLCTDT